MGRHGGIYRLVLVVRRMACPVTMTRMDQLAEAMANEPARDPPRPCSAAELGERLGMKPSYVLALQSKIRKALGWQAV